METHPSIGLHYTALGHWVRKQRRNEANNTLSQAKRDKLDSIGFAWKLRGEQATASEKPKPLPPPKKRNWEESYQALVAFKKKFGHCNVPRRNTGPGQYALGQWVSKQRLQKDSMSRRCRDKLIALGFDFECKRDKNQRMWDEKFKRLKVYKEMHGGTYLCVMCCFRFYSSCHQCEPKLNLWSFCCHAVILNV